MINESQCSFLYLFYFLYDFAAKEDVYSVQIQVETKNHWAVKSLAIGWTSVTSPELLQHFGIKLNRF